MAETKQQKRLKIASWIVLTVVPSIFAFILLFFNFGGDVKGYTDTIEDTKAKVIIIEPKINKLESDLALNNLGDAFLQDTLEDHKKVQDSLFSEISSLNKNVANLNKNVEVLMVNDNRDQKAIIEKLDKLLKERP